MKKQLQTEISDRTNQQIWYNFFLRLNVFYEQLFAGNNDGSEVITNEELNTK